MIQTKEKVIVWGIGQDYIVNKEKIENQFDVIAYTDNKFGNEQELNEKEILPVQIDQFVYDRILVASRRYYDSIRLQLVKNGVDISKICGLDSLNKNIESNERFLQVANEIEKYELNNSNPNFQVDLDNLKLITADKFMTAGTPASHYFAQDIWGARKVMQNRPKEHYDIGSRLDGFIAHLLVFRSVNYIDIRPLPFNIPNLHFIQGDATNLDQFADNSLESISSFHAIEHFGLGRYGDDINPDAYLQVIKNMQRVIQPCGHVYIGVPVGPKDKLVFNAHRIFAIKTIINLFDKLILKDIAIVKADNAYTDKITPEQYDRIEDYCCGLFEFVKE